MARRRSPIVVVIALAVGVGLAGCGQDQRRAVAFTAPTGPRTLHGAGPNAVDQLLTSGGGLWFEGTRTDPNGGCTLYSFQVGSLGEHRGLRTRYFANYVNGGCRFSGPTAPPTGQFTWSAQGTRVVLQLPASSKPEELTITRGDGAARAISLSRAGGRDGLWVGCGNPEFPLPLSAGCL
jgi:hypothetical protein